MRRWRGGNSVLKVLGGLLLTAAVLKGHELLTVPVANKDLWSWRPFLILLVELELALGIWLLSGLFKRLAWLAGLLCFGLFCCVTLYKGLTGAASCGCFGTVHVNPWITLLAVDLPALLALALFRPPSAFAALLPALRSLPSVATVGRSSIRSAIADFAGPVPSLRQFTATAALGLATLSVTTPILALSKPAVVTSAYEVLEEEYWIDSRRGFNLVRAKHSHPHEKLWYETEQTLEYSQLEDGRWVLEKATRNDVENDAVIEHRLETTAIRTDAEIPDDVFELESLKLPPDVYTLDYSFSPPLELNRGNLPDVDYLQDLMDTPVESNQIASVAADGHVTIGDHAAFIQHEKNSPSEHLAQDGPVQMQVFTRARRALPWIVGFVLAISVSFGVFSWQCRVRRARQ